MTETKKTSCRICASDCGLITFLEKGKVTRVEGDPDNPNNRKALCVKGKNSPRMIYAPDRILQPLKKIRGKGEDQFVPISWEQALEEISDRLFQLKEAYGPQSLCIYQGKSTRFIDRTFISAFARHYGTPNTTGVWSLCVGPKILGYQAVFGKPLFPFCDFQRAKLILLWGTNPVNSRMNRYMRVYKDIMQAKKNGAKLVLIDPRPHKTARSADVHLALRPGSDIYLVMALLKILVQEQQVNQGYINKHISGFAALSDLLEQLDLGRLIRKTDLEPNSVHQLAQDLARIKPASIDRREGAIHQRNGTQLNQALAMLNAITGNVDVPGGLSFWSHPRWDNSLGIKSQVEHPRFWDERFPLAADCSGLIPQAILDQRPYPIKALFTVAGNPVSSLPNTRKTIQALKSLELLVVNDLYLTETAKLADYIIPGTTFFEKGEFETGILKPYPLLKVTAPVIPPLGQSRPEWKFFADLTAYMGNDELLSYSNEDQVMRRVFRDSGYPELHPEDLRSGKQVISLHPGMLLQNGFNTASGKMEFYSEWFRENNYPPLPEFFQENQENTDYPLYLVTGSRLDPYFHSQHRNIPELRKLAPQPVAEISGELADQLDIGHADKIKVQTRKGEITLNVKILENMHSKTISISHGWSGDKNINYLLDDQDYDPPAGTPAYKAVSCAAQKAN